MPHTLDATAVHRWCGIALAALRRRCEEINAVNVYPVADGDTGTNMLLTLESGQRALAEAGETASPGEATRALAHGALLGARGNSGTLLAQILLGVAAEYEGADAAERAPEAARRLRAALTRAARAAYDALAHPVEGTLLTVVAAAARGAERADPADVQGVADAAYRSAAEALVHTPEQLEVLAAAGVVDAGGMGLLEVLGGLVAALRGEAAPPDPLPTSAVRAAVGHPLTPGVDGAGEPTPDYEVMYLLDADDSRIPSLRADLDALGDSLVLAGGGGLWNVHVHVADAGAAVEAALTVGRPRGIRITHLGQLGQPGGPGGLDATAVAANGCGAATDTNTDATVTPSPADGAAPSHQRAVVAVVRGDGLARLFTEAGARVLRDDGAGTVDRDALLRAVHAADAAEVVLLPNDTDLRLLAEEVAGHLTGQGEGGPRLAVIPTRAAVQGISALAVHLPHRPFDQDVVAMTSAAGATRFGELSLATERFWTSAGVCEAGDVLGLVDDDVAEIGTDVPRVALRVLDRMLAAGGELVTLVLGEDAPEGLAPQLEEHVREHHLAVDTVVYEGHQNTSVLLVGVE
ncbi:DAK2 domain-containing protein [Streptomyces sp. NPDC005438]|uniref:DAK2 domain-containing protein n=1 Tax=Streptomyces sp. NPDC005438 TaxID=3156880 RepID=UPI0033AE9534